MILKMVSCNVKCIRIVKNGLKHAKSLSQFFKFSLGHASQSLTVCDVTDKCETLRCCKKMVLVEKWTMNKTFCQSPLLCLCDSQYRNMVKSLKHSFFFPVKLSSQCVDSQQACQPKRVGTDHQQTVRFLHFFVYCLKNGNCQKHELLFIFY